jgi:putative transposase
VSVEIRRSSHAVYELKYHLVWVPKYRAHILGGEVNQFLKEVFQHIAEEYELHILRVAIMEDHVHLLIEAPPSYSPSEIVQVMKSISARELFKKFPKMRKLMWSGRIWNEGYFVRSIGDKLTTDVIEKYIEYQKKEDDPRQSKMFDR